MTKREQIIQAAFHRFQQQLRLTRWAAIDEVLQDGDEPAMSSNERDAVDLAAAMGLMPFEDEGPEAEVEPVSEDEVQQAAHVHVGEVRAAGPAA